jgi:hypothetical protein
MAGTISRFGGVVRGYFTLGGMGHHGPVILPILSVIADIFMEN